MSELARLSVSLDRALYEKLDMLVWETGYASRSELVRDLIRSRLVKREWDRDDETVATLTLISNRRTSTQELLELLPSDVQLLAATQVSLDREHSAEMIMIRGRPGDLQDIAGALGKDKHILHMAVSMSSTGAALV